MPVEVTITAISLPSTKPNHILPRAVQLNQSSNTSFIILIANLLINQGNRLKKPECACHALWHMVHHTIPKDIVEQNGKVAFFGAALKLRKTCQDSASLTAHFTSCG